MSKVQGFFPLFLATAFGVANGVWVFGPAFKEQKENESQPMLQPVVSDEVNAAQVKELRDIETAISRASATQSALKPASTSPPWWSNLGFWNRETPQGNTKEKEETSATQSGSPPMTSGTQKESPQSKDTISQRPATDSVIGKMADKCAKDPDLKVLVGAIANGEATTEQTKRFHIYLDELKRP